MRTEEIKARIEAMFADDDYDEREPGVADAAGPAGADSRGPHRPGQ